MRKSKLSTASEEYRRFEKQVMALIAVPKSEIEKHEAEYQKQKKVTKGRKIARSAERVATLLLLCALAGISVLSQASAQDKQSQTPKPEITTGASTEWSRGPDSSSARTSLTAPDGSSMMIFDYLDKSEDRIKELLKGCTKDAVGLVEEKPGPKVKGVRRRTLAIFRDLNGRESAVLCRSDGKHMLTMIYGNSIENVLGLERTEFPKK
jgi:hypothetical protein